jgi:alcohol dehydrogenase (cytochrome c)
MYVPMQRSCSQVTAVPADFSPMGFGFLGMAQRNQPLEDTDQLGTIYGISAGTGETAWMYEQRAGMLSLVATGGGLLFGGDGAGRFRAFDQQTGEILWEVNLGSAVTGFPVTYSVDGRQYVAVSTGIWRAGPQTPEIRVSGASNLFVFALP